MVLLTLAIPQLFNSVVDLCLAKAFLSDEELLEGFFIWLDPLDLGIKLDFIPLNGGVLEEFPGFFIEEVFRDVVLLDFPGFLILSLNFSNDVFDDTSLVVNVIEGLHRPYAMDARGVIAATEDAQVYELLMIHLESVKNFS